MQLNLIIVQLQIYTTLVDDLGCKCFDVVLRLQFLLKLCQYIQAENLLITLCFLVMFRLDNLRQFDVKGILDIIDADVSSQSAKVDEITFRKDTLTNLAGNIRHVYLVNLEFYLKLTHGLILTHLNDSPLHIFEALIDFTLCSNKAFCLIDGIIDLLAKRRNVGVHLAKFNIDTGSKFLCKLPSSQHGLGSIIVRQNLLMFGIATSTCSNHTLKDA